MNKKPLNIGFVSTRLTGTDGVSLEAFKWAHIFREFGHECFYFAGECDCEPARSMVIPEAHFSHPQILELNENLFDRTRRSWTTTEGTHNLRARLRGHLEEFIGKFSIDVLVAENVLSLPMNVPLGLALTELVAELGLPTIAHHHDFSWERERYLVHAADDFISAAFPPSMPSIHNVVINSYAARELARRTGMISTIVPNVMDYDHEPPAQDDYGNDLREMLDIPADHFLLLQPTRIVPRKRIELAIQLAKWLELPCTVVVSHGSGDEGTKYQGYVERLARSLAVPLRIADKHFDIRRRRLKHGKKIYSLGDAYQCADLVTYPSLIEGFGNAFLEAIYFRRPIVLSSYEIFKTDIQPKGFQVINFNGFLTDQTIEKARNVLLDKEVGKRMADHNYELARKHFSYRKLRAALESLLNRSLEGLY